jgi:MSHA biogenesis protein MshO
MRMRVQPAGGARTKSPRERGLTLVELVVVIVILGVITVVAGSGYQEAMQSYNLARSQAELADAADGALRRVGRDIRVALPNSVRVTSSGGVFHLEMIETKNGGRYRGTGGGDILDADTTTVETSFETLGALASLPNQALVAGDRVVIMNLNSGSTATELDDNAYNMAETACTAGTYSSRCNVQSVAGVSATATSTTITFSGSGRDFPRGSPGGRFAVIPASPGITYVCTPGGAVNGTATGSLRRFANYVPSLAQVTPSAGSPPAGGTEALVVEHVISCNIVVRADLGVAYLQLGLQREGASSTLYHEVRVPNGM